MALRLKMWIEALKDSEGKEDWRMGQIVMDEEEIKDLHDAPEKAYVEYAFVVCVGFNQGDRTYTFKVLAFVRTENGVNMLNGIREYLKYLGWKERAEKVARILERSTKSLWVYKKHVWDLGGLDPAEQEKAKCYIIEHTIIKSFTVTQFSQDIQVSLAPVKKCEITINYCCSLEDLLGPSVYKRPDGKLR